jgi:hypothetical protein
MVAWSICWLFHIAVSSRVSCIPPSQVAVRVVRSSENKQCGSPRFEREYCLSAIIHCNPPRYNLHVAIESPTGLRTWLPSTAPLQPRYRHSTLPQAYRLNASVVFPEGVDHMGRAACRRATGGQVKQPLAPYYKLVLQGPAT